MSLLLLEGFDDGLHTGRWSSSTASPVGTGSNRIGLALRWLSNYWLHYLMPASEYHDTVTVGFWFQLDTFPTASWLRFVTMFGSADNLYLAIDTVGALLVRNDADTVLGQTSGNIWTGTGTSHYVEWQVYTHDTAGWFKVWVDGNLEIDVSGVDTNNGGGTDITRVLFRFYTAANAQGYLDDIYITNGAGAAPHNGRLGDIAVDTLLPNGNGAASDFVGSDADQIDNYLLVDEAPFHDSDTTYVESAVDTDRDSYGHSDLVYSAGAIKGAITNAVVRNTGAGDNAKVSTRISGTDYDGAATVVPASYDASVKEIWETSPATGVAWTIAEINAAEFGIQNVV